MPSDVTIPANVEAEAAVLAALLIDPSSIGEVAFLRAEDFYRERNGWIFQAILNIQAAGEVPDFVTVTDALERDGKLAAVGGATYLVELTNALPSSVYAETYGKIVFRDAIRRRMIGAASTLAALAQQSIEPTDLVSRGMQLIEDAAGDRLGATDNTLLWKDSFLAWEGRQLERADEIATEAPRMSMPWRGLSSVLPLSGGTFAVVVAASSVGKTMFMECCAEHWAKLGFRVAFLHFELSEQNMLDRRICRWTGRTMEDIANGGLRQAESDAHAIAERWKGGINYVYANGWTAQQVIARLRNLAHRGECDVAVLDYLQLLNVVVGRGMNETSAFDKDVQRLKDFCGQIDIPLMAGSQLNGEGQSRARKSAADARYSKAIVDKANLAITLDRPILDKPIMDGNRVVVAAGKRSPETTVRVDKQTMGDVGDYTLIAVPGRFMFADVENHS